MQAQRKTGRAELRSANRAGRPLLWAVVLFSFFVNLLMLTGPLFMLQIYDRVLSSQSEETLTALFILVSGLFILMGLLDYARGRVMARYAARFQSMLDHRLFDANLDAQLKRGSGGHGQALLDMEVVQRFMASPVFLAILDVPWTPFFIALIFIFHPLLGWLALAGAGILLIVTLLNNVLTKRWTESASELSAAAQLIASEAQQRPEIIRAQGMREAIRYRWLTARFDALKESLGAADFTGTFSSFTKAFRLFLQSAMLAVGAWLVLNGELTAGAMIAGSILLGRALAPVEQLIGQWQFIQSARLSRKNLADLLDEIPTPSKTVGLPKPQSNISLSNVTVLAADGETPLLAQINLTISPGEVVGVIGKSGSGKSTLARTIMGLTTPVSGEVKLDGASLPQYSEAELGAAIGYLPQDVSLFPVTISENIARMAIEPDQAKVQVAAIKAKAHELIKNLPSGYQTVLDAIQARLSGGQVQRIALARALYDDPSLLVLDEPNSALDAEGTAALNAAIRDFKAKDRAVILMTHRPVAISECERLVVIEQGRIIADGLKEDVMKQVLRNASNLENVTASKEPTVKKAAPKTKAAKTKTAKTRITKPRTSKRTKST